MILLRLKDFAAGEWNCTEVCAIICTYLGSQTRTCLVLTMPIPPTLLRDRLPDRDRELDVRVPFTLYNTTFTKFQHVRLKGGG